jgi:hypothetical protein
MKKIELYPVVLVYKIAIAVLVVLCFLLDWTSRRNESLAMLKNELLRPFHQESLGETP